MNIPQNLVELISVLFVIYLSILGLKSYEKLEFEGKNKLFKKFFKEKNIKRSNILGGVIEIINPININDNFLEGKIKEFFIELYKVFNDYDDYIQEKRNYLTLIDDSPITLGDKDILGVYDFSKNIAEIIDGILFSKNSKSFSIGIVGEWGLGKSSIVNILKEKYLEGYPQYMILNFNPWNFEKKDLIEKFFIDLSNTIGLKNIKGVISNYLDALGELNNTFKLFKILKRNQRTEDIKNELNYALQLLGDKKIIVIIDDLDRCNHHEVITVLNIIKNLGDLSNIIYVVSYDKKNIISILEKEGFDKNYLDKIINIEKYVPKNTKEQLKKYFKAQLFKIFQDIFEEKDKINGLGHKIRNSLAHNFLGFQKLNESIIELQKVIGNTLSGLNQVYKELGIVKSSEDVEENKQEIKNNTEKQIIKKDNLDELFDYLIHQLDYVFENENLRLLKKLLNHLNIIFKVNFNTISDIQIINSFTKEDYFNIFLINYIKIKDYSFFTEVMNYYYVISDKKDFSIILKGNIPNFILDYYNNKELFLKKKFLLLFFELDFETTTQPDKHGTPNAYNYIKTGNFKIRAKKLEGNLKLILERFN